MAPACPICCVPLAATATAAGTASDCPRCGGRWAPLATLRGLHQREAIDAAWRAACFGEADVGEACPGCRRLMAEVPLAGGLIDLCRGCQAAWFGRATAAALPPPTVRIAAAPAPAAVPPPPPETAAIRASREMRRRQQEGEPIGDGPNERWKWFAGFLGLPVKMGSMETEGPPWANWGLCGAILLLGLLTMGSGLKETVEAWGFVPAASMRHAGATWVTAFFLHAGLVHLLGNLWFLWMTGDNVADRLGTRRYLGLVLAATLAGALFHLLGDPRSEVPCIGASGGISGVMAVFALVFPKAQIGQAWFWGRIWLRLPAWVWFGFWVLMQLWLAHQQIAGFSNVSALAHLGGAAMGAGLYWWWRPRSAWDPRPPPPRPA